MNEQCKDCIYVQNLEKKVVELQVKVKELEERINKIEKSTAVTDEQVKMIFKILNEIKDSIEKVGNKIDEIESRPSKLLWGVICTAAGALIMIGLKFIGR